MADEAQAHIVPVKFVQTRASWKRSSRRWAVAHYVLGVGAAAGSMLAGTQPGSLGITETGGAWIGLITGIVVGAITFLNPLTKSKKYQRALNTLRDACRRYEFEERVEVNLLNDAAAAGERIIQEDD